MRAAVFVDKEFIPLSNGKKILIAKLKFLTVAVLRQFTVFAQQTIHNALLVTVTQCFYAFFQRRV